jgi:amidase
VVEHALTRSVRDSAAFLDAISGNDLGDPYWAPPPTRPYIKELTSEPNRLRIAFSTQAPLGTDVHPDCVEAVTSAASLCAELGHDVEDAAPVFEVELVWQSFTTVLAAGLAWTIANCGRRTGQTPTSEFFEPFVWSFAQKGNGIDAQAYLLALQDLQRAARDIARFFVDYHIWLTPTISEPPVPLGTFGFSSGDDPIEFRRRVAAFSPFTYISNVTGQPAMSVPLYWNSDGLPIGTHFSGRFGDEATLFQLAAQLEKARPWSDRRPRVSA